MGYEPCLHPQITPLFNSIYEPAAQRLKSSAACGITLDVTKQMALDIIYIL